MTGEGGGGEGGSGEGGLVRSQAIRLRSAARCERGGVPRVPRVRPRRLTRGCPPLASLARGAKARARKFPHFRRAETPQKVSARLGAFRAPTGG